MGQPAAAGPGSAADRPEDLRPEDLRLAGYDFHLPPALIAQTPATLRDAARLLVLAGDAPPDHRFVHDLPDLLRPGDLLIRNDTRVIPARLLGRRAGGGKAELLLVHPAASPGSPAPLDPTAPTAPTTASTTTAALADGGELDPIPRQDPSALAGSSNPFSLCGAIDHPGHPDDPWTWVCLARPATHLKPGKVVRIGAGPDGEGLRDAGSHGAGLDGDRPEREGAGAEAYPLRAEILERLGQGRVVARLIPSAPCRLSEILERVGRVPLPPYIERTGKRPTPEDRARYQTTYAARDGAVAAPTAGLHFTPDLDAALRAHGVEIAALTLHVGPGTFRPMIAEDIRAHRVDGEWYEIPEATAAAVNAAKAAGRRVIAVGTTSTRTLESAALLAEAEAKGGGGGGGVIRAGSGWADLFIRPGHRFRVIDGLMTNFHLPRSSLLVLVSALMGRERMLAAYAEAVARGYRFYSYGDASLLLPAGL